MARIEGIGQDKASFISKALHWVVQRRMGRVSEPWKVAAHVPRLHMGRALFELMLDKSTLVPRRLRRLACIKTAMLIGCHA